ncbi:MAG: leucine-rich repeat domain-containing protein [Nitrospirota bacterium]
MIEFKLLPDSNLLIPEYQIIINHELKEHARAAGRDYVSITSNDVETSKEMLQHDIKQFPPFEMFHLDYKPEWTEIINALRVTPSSQENTYKLVFVSWRNLSKWKNKFSFEEYCTTLSEIIRRRGNDIEFKAFEDDYPGLTSFDISMVIKLEEQPIINEIKKCEDVIREYHASCIDALSKDARKKYTVITATKSDRSHNPHEIIHNALKKDASAINLKSCSLSEIPDELFELTNLKELYLTRNNLSGLPQKITVFQKLEKISLNRNNFSFFPERLLELPNLEFVSMSGNKINSIPIRISALKNLISLNLAKNEIQEIPREIADLVNLESLILSNNKIDKLPLELTNLKNLSTLVLLGNPLTYPPYDIVDKGIYRIMHFLTEEKFTDKTNARNKYKEHYTIFLPEKIKTAISQYLLYFKDFVRNVKNMDVYFEIKTVENGIEIEVAKDPRNGVIADFLEEYLGLIKKNHEDFIAPKFAYDIDQTRKDIVMVELRNQVRFLKSSLEIKTVENRMLNETVNKFYGLLLVEKQHPLNYIIKAKAISNASSKNELTLNLNSELPVLLEDFNSFKKELEGIEEVKPELEKIDEGLLSIDDDNQITDIDKTPFKRLKRILDEINDPDSTLNRIISASKKGVDATKKLARTYNKFAEWLGLPTIPRVLIE